MTTTAKAASNGHPDPATTAPERITGMARVQEAQVYHLASIAHDAAFEAERLCNEIYRSASDAYLRNVDVSDAAVTVAEPVTQDKITEACCCLVAAIDHLLSLRSDPL